MAENPTTAELHSVTVTRELDAPAWRVWEAWTEPDQFAQWFFTPPFTTPAESVKFDVRPGGHWEAKQVNVEDGMELPFAGHYIETDAPKRLVFAFEDTSDPNNKQTEIATVDLVDLGNGRTEMTLRQEGHMPAEQYPLLHEGYSRFFDNLEKLLATAG